MFFFSGAVFQETGDYDASFFLGGALFLCGSLLHFALFLPCLNKKAVQTLNVPSPTEVEMNNLTTSNTEVTNDVKPAPV